MMHPGTWWYCGGIQIYVLLELTNIASVYISSAPPPPAPPAPPTPPPPPPTPPAPQDSFSTTTKATTTIVATTLAAVSVSTYCLMVLYCLVFIARDNLTQVEFMLTFFSI